jgi:hypothetical protein
LHLVLLHAHAEASTVSSAEPYRERLLKRDLAGAGMASTRFGAFDTDKVSA